MDVVGVENGSDGRSCVQHSVCGHFVTKDDMLYCKWAIQTFEGEAETCVQVFKLAADGQIGCHVGYLPRRLVKASRDEDGKKDGGKSYDGTWLKVVADLRLSDNSSERARSHRNCGIVYCHVSNDPLFIGKNPFEAPIDLPNNDGNDDGTNKRTKEDFVPSSRENTSSEEEDGKSDDEEE